MHDAVSDRGDRDHAHLASLLRNRSSSVRSGLVRAVAQFRSEFRQELVAAALLDPLERLAVGPGGAAVALCLQVRDFECVELHEVDVQSPKPMLGGRLRPMAYPPLKVLRVNRGLCHPARLASCADYPR